MKKIIKFLSMIFVFSLFMMNVVSIHADTKEVAFFELADTEENDMYFGNPNEDTPITTNCGPQAVSLPHLFLQSDYKLFKEGFNAANPASGTKDVDAEYSKPIWENEFKGTYESETAISVIGYVSEDDFFVIKDANVSKTIDSFSILYTLPVDDYVYSPIDFNVYFRPAGTCQDTDDTSVLTAENLSGTLKLKPTHDFTGGWHCYQRAAGDLNKQISSGKYDIYIQVVANKKADDLETKQFMGNFWEFRLFEGTVSGNPIATADPQATEIVTEAPTATIAPTDSPVSTTAVATDSQIPSATVSESLTNGNSNSGNNTIIIVIGAIVILGVIGAGVYIVLKRKK